MRGEAGQMSLQLPRPGPVLKAVLATLLVFGIGGALLANWTHWGQVAFDALTCTPGGVVHHFRLWSLLTSGVLTDRFGQLFFALIGFYFLSPDLERRWGSRRFAAFLAASIVFGNLFVIAVDHLSFLSSPIFHPEKMFGPTAAITAIAVGWSRENAETEVRLMFFLPVKGKHLFWISVAYCFVGIVYNSGLTDGVMAPFGGVLVGMSLGGSPSMLRRGYLQLKLALLKRQAAGPTARAVRAASVRKARAGGPALRVLPGGLEEELRKREPPKDKRYLN